MRQLPWALLFLGAPSKIAHIVSFRCRCLLEIIMKSGRKVGHTRLIRGKDLFFFFFRVTIISGEKSERRDQSSFSFLENINFWKTLPRAPEFEYPPLVEAITHLYISEPNRPTPVRRRLSLTHAGMEKRFPVVLS